MNKLRLSIIKQKEKYEDLSLNNDFFTINDPIYETVHMNIICKNKLQEQTKMIAEHFYNIDYLTKIYEENYEELKRRLIMVLILLTILLVIFFSCIVLTFSYLENKELALIPLISLIILTIVFALFLINILRLKVIEKIIEGKYTLDKKLIFLILYKLKKEEIEDKIMLAKNGNLNENINNIKDGDANKDGKLNENCGDESLKYRDEFNNISKNKFI